MKGITFNAEMIRALADGRKTQTRRPIKDMIEQPDPDCYFDAENKGERWNWWYPDNRMKLPQVSCPYGKVGDRLFVQEEFVDAHGVSNGYHDCYFRDSFPLHWDAENTCHGEEVTLTGEEYEWTPAKEMPEELSRYTIEIVDIRVERVQDIGEDDAIAEGIIVVSGNDGDIYKAPNYPNGCTYGFAKNAFSTFWDSIYRETEYAWKHNGYVRAIEFRKVEK